MVCPPAGSLARFGVRRRSFGRLIGQSSRETGGRDMGRFWWPLGLAVAFALGLAAGGLARGVVGRSPDAERLQAVVDRQELQIQALETRIRGDQSRMLGRASAGGGRWEDVRPASVAMVDPAQRSSG